MKQALLPLFLLPFALFSQTANGRVSAANTGEIIAFPEVQTLSQKWAQGNEFGIFEFPVDSFPVQLIVSAPEYLPDTILFENESLKEISLQLDTTWKETNIGVVVITASRRKQDIAEVPISMDIIRPELIENKGIVDLEQVVDQVPGVYAMDGQISIRGGSGFSYGAGSRVSVLWNEMPLLSGDAGDVKWNSVPIEQTEQIEIIKGASSVLYGSGALNGIISLREREPGSDRRLMVKYQMGAYDDPKRESLKWWGDAPMQHQADVAFSQQFKKIGLNLGAYGFTNNGYREGETEDRGRFNGSLFWKPANIPKMKVALGWNVQFQKTGNFILWKSDEFAYQPLGGVDTAGSTMTYNKGLRIMIDPTVKSFDRFGNKHQLKTRLYYIDNNNITNPSQSTTSNVSYGDYQFQRIVGNNAWVLTTGTTWTSNVVQSSLFGDHSSLNAALYAQGERKWKKLDLTGGVRAEYFEQDGKQGDSDAYFFGKDSSKIPIRPIFRAGAHYKLFKFTHLRASFGQGVRYPSVAERFTQTTVGSLLVFPNPTLVPETGWAIEFGVKQGLKVGNWRGFADASVFLNHYDDMTEFTFGLYIPDNIPINFTDPNDPGYVLKWLGFRAENAEKAQIAGFELTLTGEGKIGPILVQTLMGYTYMDPVSLNKDSAYRATFSNPNSNMLKYRFHHLARADVQLEWNSFSLGGTLRVNSFMENIDKVFEEGILGQEILVGLKDYRTIHNGVTSIVDLRVGYEFKEKYKVSLIVNNVANAEYMTRPGDVQAPRNILLQFRFEL